MQNLRLQVFLPPLLLIVATIVFSQLDHASFSAILSGVNQWILDTFGFLFSWSSFLFIVLLVVIYFSSLGKRKIGGETAEPLLSRPRWFAISICTTIATGILFWGCAEPLHHYANPPLAEVASESAAAVRFSMSTMFMHWSFTPYAIYCVAGLSFALAYYNRGEAFRVASMVSPRSMTEYRNLAALIDTLCLFALVLGMSASLGAGILSLVGGLGELFDLSATHFMIGLVGAVIIISFIASAVSGLQRGIKWLSSVNIIGFILLASFIFLSSYPREIVSMAWEGSQEYLLNFAQRSLNIGSGIDPEWQQGWSVFYWANWFAWAPVTALFLGRIARGYTVRQFIHFNLVFPALFAIVWMSIFSGATLNMNALTDNLLLSSLQTAGEESVMYQLLRQLGHGAVTIPITLFLIFISYVTAADSNISAMSKMSEKRSLTQDGEASIFTKVTWGLVIGGLTYTMLATKGIEGIKIMSVLGGLPALFIIIAAGISLARMCFRIEMN